MHKPFLKNTSAKNATEYNDNCKVFWIYA
jgi:hypothetical protein